MRERPWGHIRSFQTAVSRPGTGTSPCHHSGVESLTQTPSQLLQAGREAGGFVVRIIAAAWLLALPATGNAQNVINDVNNAMLNIIQNTSASLIDGPPE